LAAKICIHACQPKPYSRIAMTFYRIKKSIGCDVLKAIVRALNGLAAR